MPYKREREARKWVVRMLGLPEDTSYMDAAIAAMQNTQLLTGRRAQWEIGGWEPAKVLLAVYQEEHRKPGLRLM